MLSLLLSNVRFLVDDLLGRSIASISVFPNRVKGFLLVLALPSLHDMMTEGSQGKHPTGGIPESGAPTMSTSMLRLYDLSTYRCVR